jgi:serine/threonine protein kinase/tetratricopeptide (TPR) repeat protein
MIGKTLAQFRITDEIGRGGMGEVYRATDTRLGREVAIKVLPAEVAADPERLQRFEREARAVAALSHPNILAIHDFAVEEGVAYAVTELLEGETLRQELTRRGRLPIDRAITFAIGTVRGLAASHDKGIVHRDLKPENVFITEEGQVKILDFGLAKVERSSESIESSAGIEERGTEAFETDPGSVIGTVSYMSPEQARGESTDQRSDLFSFGVVVYEMLTGKNPFLRGSAAETMSSILRDDPPPAGRVVSEVPEELDRMVGHCLEKNPAVRARSAHDLAFHLEAVHRSLSSGASPPSPRAAAPGTAVDSLAVLPFLNQSGDPDAEYLSDGITETIIDNLSQLPSLRVMARSTVFSYKDRDVDPRRVGQELGIRAVLTGRLLQRGDTLVIRAELVDASDGSRLWGGHYDRSLDDLLAVERDLAREISEKLRLKLSGKEKRRLAKRHTENAEAHQAYLKGRFIWNRWTLEGMEAAINHFERALALDPDYALAYAGLADSYSVLGNIKALPPDEAYGKAKMAALEGLALDNGIGELHASLGFVQRFYAWDWDAAQREFEQAIQLTPGYATGHRWYAQFLSGMARHDEAIVEAEKALELDPLSLSIHTAVGDVYFYARRYDEAIGYYQRALEMDPQFQAAHTDLARAYEHKGMYEEAIEEFRIGADLAPKGPPEPSSGLAHVFARMGRRDEALQIIEELKDLAGRRYVSPYGIASIYACLGETDLALEWLEKAYADHDQTLVFIKVHPRLDPLRSDPRFEDLLRRMNL